MRGGKLASPVATKARTAFCCSTRDDRAASAAVRVAELTLLASVAARMALRLASTTPHMTRTINTTAAKARPSLRDTLRLLKDIDGILIR